MKIFCYLIIFNALALVTNLFGQEIKIKEGAYRNLIEFHKNRTFIQDAEFSFKPIDKGQFYKIRDKNHNVEHYVFKYDVWAIYHDSTFYINLARLGMGTGFSKIIEFGRYSFFHGRMAKTADQKQREYTSYREFGLLGLAITNNEVVKELGKNEFYLLNLEKGTPENININHMMLILRDEEDLYNQYSMEPDKETLDIMLMYLRKLNKRLPLY